MRSQTRCPTATFELCYRTTELLSQERRGLWNHYSKGLSHLIGKDFSKGAFSAGSQGPAPLSFGSCRAAQPALCTARAAGKRNPPEYCRIEAVCGFICRIARENKKQGWWWIISLVISPLLHMQILNTPHLFPREGSLSSSLHALSRPSMSSLVVAHWKCSCFAMLWRPGREKCQGFSWKPSHISFPQTSDLWLQNHLSSRTSKGSPAHTCPLRNEIHSAPQGKQIHL